MESLESLRVFVEVVKQESFSKAAEVLGVSKSHVSKQIKELEEELGTTLLHRTTRQQRLSDSGKLLYERCDQLFEDLSETLCLLQARQTEPQGRLRISAPLSLSLGYLGPLVCEYSLRFPDVEVEFHLSDRFVELVEEGYDVVLRVGELEDSSLMARRLAPIRRVLCASPSYLKQNPAPTHPHDLKEHRCLLYQHSRTPATWSFQKGEERISVKVPGNLFSNNGDILLQGARAGAGLVLLPEFLVAPALANRELEVLMAGWEDQWKASLWALFPPHSVLSAKVRTFVDFLVEAFSPRPPWDFWQTYAKR